MALEGAPEPELGQRLEPELVLAARKIEELKRQAAAVGSAVVIAVAVAAEPEPEREPEKRAPLASSERRTAGALRSKGKDLRSPSRAGSPGRKEQRYTKCS